MAANHEAMISRIQNTRFGTSWRERTYDEKEVDDFLDEVKKTLGEGHLPDPAKVRNAKFSVTGLLWPGYVILDVDDLLDEIERYVGGLSQNGAKCGDLPPRLGSTRALTAAIRRFTGGRNDRCQPFVRTKPPRRSSRTQRVKKLHERGTGTLRLKSCGARLLDLAWLAESSGLGSSLSDLLNRLLPRALHVRLRDGAGPA